jgi:WD and tetratricopeptide repeat-containing protein 1
MCSGAMDCQVHVSRIETQRVCAKFSCHKGRVKDVAVHAEDPIFWSASEDGTCRQFDLREQHTCSDQETPCGNVLIQSQGSSLSLKSIHVNPVFSYYMAFACGDQYIRLYDRRKLSAKTLKSEGTACALVLSPSHLRPKHHSTFCQFSPTGDQIVASYSGESIYIFDLYHQYRITECEAIPPFSSSLHSTSSSSAHHSSLTPTSPSSPLQFLNDRVNIFKEKGNEAFKKGDYNGAISYYNQAIVAEDGAVHAVLYCNRAAAFLKRLYHGDGYMALSDCEAAIDVDAKYVKAYYRKIQALKQIGRIKDALECASAYQKMFPESGSDFAQLIKQLKDAEKKHNEEQKRKKERKSGSMFADDSSDEDDEMQEEKTQKNQTLNGKLNGQRIHNSFLQRLVGHSNVQTDIKEATFWGNFILSGSDDGCVFIWSKNDGRLFNILSVSDDVINCVRGHPHEAAVVTSGIEHSIKVWAPTADSTTFEIAKMNSQIEENQKRMTSGPQARFLWDPLIMEFLLQQYRMQHGAS